MTSKAAVVALMAPWRSPTLPQRWPPQRYPRLHQHCTRDIENSLYIHGCSVLFEPAWGGLPVSPWQTKTQKQLTTRNNNHGTSVRLRPKSATLVSSLSASILVASSVVPWSESCDWHVTMPMLAESRRAFLGKDIQRITHRYLDIEVKDTRARSGHRDAATVPGDVAPRLIPEGTSAAPTPHASCLSPGANFVATSR